MNMPNWIKKDWAKAMSQPATAMKVSIISLL